MELGSRLKKLEAELSQAAISSMAAQEAHQADIAEAERKLREAEEKLQVAGSSNAEPASSGRDAELEVCDYVKCICYIIQILKVVCECCIQYVQMGRMCIVFVSCPGRVGKFVASC